MAPTVIHTLSGAGFGGSVTPTQLGGPEAWAGQGLGLAGVGAEAAALAPDRTLST